MFHEFLVIIPHKTLPGSICCTSRENVHFNNFHLRVLYEEDLAFQLLRELRMFWMALYGRKTSSTLQFSRFDSLINISWMELNENV